MNILAQRWFARRIWEIQAFKDKTRSPEGKGFKLKLHQTNPNAPLSPFYIDLRLLQSDFEAKRCAVQLFATMVTSAFGGSLPDRLGAIPEAIVPVVSSLSDLMQIPMITPRQPKGHGSGAKIDGIWKAGERVVLFDDVVTGADSKLEAATTVRSVNLVTTEVLVLVDREQGGRKLLKEANLDLHAAMTVTDLLDFYLAEKLMSRDLHQEIQAYRSAA